MDDELLMRFVEEFQSLCFFYTDKGRKHPENRVILVFSKLRKDIRRTSLLNVINQFYGESTFHHVYNSVLEKKGVNKQNFCRNKLAF